MSQAETQLCKAIRDAIAWDHDVLCVRVNSGSIPKHGGRIKLADAGTSDLLLCVRRVTARLLGGTFGDGVLTCDEGRFCALEIKVHGSRTKPAREKAQGEFLDRVRELGGFGARVTSVDEARAAIARCKKGCME